VLSLATVNYWPAFPSPNERARAYQALAVASRGSLAIDAELARFGGMEDVAVHAGRTFPNKAPGLLPLLLPAAATANLAAAPDSRLALTLWLGRLLAATLPSLLTVLLLARLTAARYPRGGPVVTVAWALASPALTAALTLFAHALTAFLLLAAWSLLFAARPSTRAGVLAGASLGWAFACEYQLAVPAAVLAVAALPAWRGRALSVVAGGAVPLALLAAYNLACFGSPFSLSSANEGSAAFAELASRGVFGISTPTAAGLVGLLLSPARGLLVFAPFVVLAAVAPRVATAETGRGGRAALLLAPLALLLLMSGYPNWHGGMFPGPRYLLGALPLLAVAAAPGAERLARRRRGTALLAALTACGALAVWPITATFPFPPPGEPFPSLVLARQLAAWGALFPSWLPGPAALAVWVGAATVGLAAVALAVADRRAMAAGAIVAVAAAAAAARTPAPADWPSRLARAVIHDVFLAARPGTLEVLRRECASSGQCAQVDAWLRRREASRSALQGPAS